jgi:hypothetical protein
MQISVRVGKQGKVAIMAAARLGQGPQVGSQAASRWMILSWEVGDTPTSQATQAKGLNCTQDLKRRHTYTHTASANRDDHYRRLTLSGLAPVLLRPTLFYYLFDMY